MASFKEEKLTPLIHVIRKLESCDADQRVKVLLRLPHIFQSHGKLELFQNIMVRGLCEGNVYDNIPTSLYEEMQSILPKDKDLDLKDSVYESRLVETPEDSDEDHKAKKEKKKKKLPLSLLRIPTDLQCHLFHHLNITDLSRMQRVCRALCIAARNPLSLYLLHVDLRSSNNRHMGTYFNTVGDVCTPLLHVQIQPLCPLDTCTCTPSGRLNPLNDQLIITHSYHKHSHKQHHAEACERHKIDVNL